MTEKEFEVGDLVYCPTLGTGIYQLEGVAGTSSFRVRKTPESISALLLSPKGTNFGGRVKMIFPATEENRKKLELEYGQNFEVADDGSDGSDTEALVCNCDNCIAARKHWSELKQAAESAAEEFNALGDKVKKSNIDILKGLEIKAMEAMEASKAAVKISDERIKISDAAIRCYKKAVEAHVRGEALADVFADYEFSNTSGLKIVVVENGFECNCLKCKVKRIFKNMLGA